jgi:hypothetical protein
MLCKQILLHHDLHDHGTTQFMLCKQILLHHDQHDDSTTQFMLCKQDNPKQVGYSPSRLLVQLGSRTISPPMSHAPAPMAGQACHSGILLQIGKFEGIFFSSMYAAPQGMEITVIMVGGERTTCASTASSLNLRRANARRPLTHSITVISLSCPLRMHCKFVRQGYTD